LNVRRAVLAFWLLTLVYVCALLWIDHDKGLLSGIARLQAVLPVLMLLSFGSYLARFARWQWLLTQAGAGAAVPLGRGFVAYLAGFALTSSPGKMGELLRIRYLRRFGTAPETVVGAFVCERVWDLLVVLSLASLCAVGSGLLPVALAFVVLVLSAVVLFARFPSLGLRAAEWLRQRHWLRLTRWVEVLAHGFEQLVLWRKPKDLLVCALCGFVAWGLTAYAFVVLLDHLGLSVPTVLAFSILPLAMLVGAASMIPGGIGSTEAVVVVLLSALEFSVADGAIAAIGIRIATLWFATLLGLLCMLALEFAPESDSARSSS
jgi:uncharacterized protein (TIRG00374 family)